LKAIYYFWGLVGLHIYLLMFGVFHHEGSEEELHPHFLQWRMLSFLSYPWSKINYVWQLMLLDYVSSMAVPHLHPPPLKTQLSYYSPCPQLHRMWHENATPQACSTQHHRAGEGLHQSPATWTSSESNHHLLHQFSKTDGLDTEKGSLSTVVKLPKRVEGVKIDWSAVVNAKIASCLGSGWSRSGSSALGWTENATSYPKSSDPYCALVHWRA